MADESTRTRLATVISSARANLEARAREVNDLNVFPVADGDTGTNLLQTVQAVERAAHEIRDRESIADRCERLTRAALLGARGNSGIILSQMVRGAAEAIDAHGAFDGRALVAALRGASDTAYAAVREPVEGTMLTAIRGMADGGENAEGNGETDVEAVLQAALDAGAETLAATRDMLPQLREAGVIDSGALGVQLLMEGLAAGLAGHEVGPAIEVSAPVVAAEDHEPSRYRYCTTFILDDLTMEPELVEARLTSMGDSLLVVGDRRQAKVHIHTDEPQHAIRLGEEIGAVSGVNIDDMHRQEAARTARLSRRDGGEAGDREPLGPDTRLDMSNTAIITDSASDLPADGRPANVLVVPIPISFGTEAFLDGVTLDTAAFYERLRNGTTTPTTAAPSLGECVEWMERALDHHEYAVVLHMGANFSTTADAARRAALEVDPDRIAVIETESVSFQLGLLVHRIAARLEAGTTLREIEEFVDRFRRTQGTGFTVETLEYLRRGGRIGRAQQLVGNLLGLRPLLEVSDGVVSPVRNVRGLDRQLTALVEFVESRTDPDRPLRVGFAQALAGDRLARVRAMLLQKRPDATVDLVCDLGPTVVTHAGPGALGVTFVHDPLDERPADGG